MSGRPCHPSTWLGGTTPSSATQNSNFPPRTREHLVQDYVVDRLSRGSPWNPGSLRRRMPLPRSGPPGWIFGGPTPYGGHCPCGASTVYFAAGTHDTPYTIRVCMAKYIYLFVLYPDKQTKLLNLSVMVITWPPLLPSHQHNLRRTMAEGRGLDPLVTGRRVRPFLAPFPTTQSRRHCGTMSPRTFPRHCLG